MVFDSRGISTDYPSTNGSTTDPNGPIIIFLPPDIFDPDELTGVITKVPPITSSPTKSTGSFLIGHRPTSDSNDTTEPIVESIPSATNSTDNFAGTEIINPSPAEPDDSQRTLQNALSYIPENYLDGLILAQKTGVVPNYLFEFSFLDYYNKTTFLSQP